MLDEIRLLPDGMSILGRTGISTFSILLMAAFLAASYLMPREFKRRGLEPRHADNVVFLAVIGAIIGSKVLFVVEMYKEIRSWDDVWHYLFSGAGLVFYGGFIFAFTFIYLYLRNKELDIWTYSDGMIPMLALGYGIGRLGCLVSGDGCYGHGAGHDIPLLTMVYGPRAVQPSAGVNVWNTPLMESMASIGLFAFVWYYLRYKNFRPGFLVTIFFMYNGITRFLVEFIRINDAVIPVLDPPTIEVAGNAVLLTHQLAIASGKGAEYFFQNWHWYGFTQGQIIAVGIFVIGLGWMLRGRLYESPAAKTKPQVVAAGAANPPKKKKKKR